MNVCFVITAHGYGHASRQMEVIRVLGERHPELRVTVLSAAPEAMFREYLGAGVAVLPFHADVGLAQHDGVATDRDGTLAALAAAWGDPAAAEERLAARLRPLAPSLVVADIPPVAFGAAARLGVPSVAIGNFDWGGVYAHYARRDPAFAPWAERCFAWQALATRAIHLEPGPPLEGFREVIAAPPLARRPDLAPAVLPVPDGQRAVLASFGGFGLRDAGRLIPPLDGVTWILAPPMPDLGRPDTRHIAGVPYLALLAACDAVFTKPGYGTVCEAARCRTRILYTDRDDFPEYRWLVEWMDAHVPSVHVPLGSPAEVVGAALDRLFDRPDRWPARFDGAARAVDVIEETLGFPPRQHRALSG